MCATNVASGAHGEGGDSTLLSAGRCSAGRYLLLSDGLDDLSVGAIDGAALDVNASRVVTWRLSVLLSVSPFLVGLYDAEGGCGDCDALPSILSALLPPPGPSRDLTFGGIFSSAAGARRLDCPAALECDIAGRLQSHRQSSRSLMGV